MPILHSYNTRNPEILAFFSGLLVSFVGSLPLGTLNVVTLQLAITGGYATALWFAAGCLIAEMLYVGISLAMMDRIMKFRILLKMLQWVSLIILIALATASFVAATQNVPASNVLVLNTLHPLLFGFLLMAANPVQIPFWFGWSTVLFARKILIPHAFHYTLYIGGAGLGSLMASVLFIFGGQFLFAWFTVTQTTFHWVTGSVFTLTAFLHVRKMLPPARTVRSKRQRYLEVTGQLTSGILGLEQKPQIR
jgi:threonine/homoserine/homoserine lactone efflux protein